MDKTEPFQLPAGVDARGPYEKAIWLNICRKRLGLEPLSLPKQETK